MQKESALTKYKLYYEYMPAHIGFLRFLGLHRTIKRGRARHFTMKFITRSFKTKQNQ